MHSNVIGELVKDSEGTSWYPSKDMVSKNKVSTPFFENKKIAYRLAFGEHEQLTLAAADTALGYFFDYKPNLKEIVAEKVFENWEQFNEAVGYLDGIEVYGKVKDRPNWMEYALQSCLRLEQLTTPDKVWEYIQPTEIVVTRDRYHKKEEVYIQILCACEWEEEHGLQIILENGKELIRISGQDGQLSE